MGEFGPRWPKMNQHQPKSAEDGPKIGEVGPRLPGWKNQCRLDRKCRFDLGFYGTKCRPRKREPATRWGLALKKVGLGPQSPPHRRGDAMAPRSRTENLQFCMVFANRNNESGAKTRARTAPTMRPPKHHFGPKIKPGRAVRTKT